MGHRRGGGGRKLKPKTPLDGPREKKNDDDAERRCVDAETNVRSQIRGAAPAVEKGPHNPQYQVPRRTRQTFELIKDDNGDRFWLILEREEKKCAKEASEKNTS